MRTNCEVAKHQILQVGMLLLLVLGVCLPGTVLSEFVTVPTSKTTHDADLHFADELGVAYERVAYDWEASKLPNFEFSYDFEFHSLTAPQFDALKHHYSSWSKAGTQVTFQNTRKFTLVDFLPQSLQATFGLHFTAQFHNYSLPRFISGQESREVTQSCEMVINCWAFAYDALYAASTDGVNRITVAVGDPARLWDTLTSSRYSYLLQASASNPRIFTNTTLRNEQLHPGDYVLLWHQNPGQPLFLDHIAIVLDKDIYYEKSGSGDNTPFRVTDWVSLSKSWVTMVFHYEWRRPVVGTPFPRAATAFGLHNPAITEHFPLLKDIKPEVAKDFCLTPEVDSKGIVLGNNYLWNKELPAFATGNGRAELQGSEFIKEGLEIKVPADIYSTPIM